MGRQKNPDESSANPVRIFAILLVLVPLLSIAIVAIRSDDSSSSASIPQSSSTTPTNPPPQPDGFISQTDCMYEMRMMLDRIQQYVPVKLSADAITYDGKLPADADPRKTLQVNCSLSYLFQLSVIRFTTTENMNAAELELCSAACASAGWDYKGFGVNRSTDTNDTLFMKKGTYLIVLYTALKYPQNGLTKEMHDLLQKDLLRWAVDDISVGM